MKEKVPNGVVIGTIVAVVLLVAFLVVRMLFPPTPATVEQAGLGEPAVPGGKPGEGANDKSYMPTGEGESTPAPVEGNPYGPGGGPQGTASPGSGN
ncbi:MAG: hypothetical protein KIT11_01545 [Fimbriimonadaceae bacterium]|nr:hypothetical protein [Fimbriimonadaceae bacterium]QYK54946.1 MAG: hypothetical protein KF733_07990 [Fimbriimonadaceae bacterium]